MSSKLEQKLTDLITPLVESLGLDLVELVFVARKKSLLQVFVDKQGGVDLNDLTDLNHAISDMMDAEDPIAGAYMLEVSSPGLDRPLKTGRDFWRKIGSEVEVSFNQTAPDAAEKTVAAVTGEVAEVADEFVTLKTADATVQIALADIIKGKLIY